jgi:uncharacterized protein (DUF1800 family)
MPSNATSSSSRDPCLCPQSLKALVLILATSLGLAGCGESGSPTLESAQKATLLPATGQVSNDVPKPANVRVYAASRFLDQSSFGPNSASIADVQSLGYAQWIDRQLALPPTQIDGSPLLAWPDLNRLTKEQNDLNWNFNNLELSRAFLSAPDQLRLRTNWAISNFIVVSQNKVNPYGMTEYFNMLQRQSLGNFGDLIYEVIRNPAMGNFLDNHQNRKQGACKDCFLNENFGRELMQLFTVGVFMLNKDGTNKKDSTGKPIETYSQADVQDMTRALTGWRFDNAHLNDKRGPNVNLPNTNAFERRMIADWSGSHDAGAKTVLGVKIPAGQTAEQDARSVVDILLNHPNTGPFVGYRLIQSLVTSDPTPAFVARITAVFENNGRGVRGDLGAVVKAILLDPEARRADDPAFRELQVGRIKEPLLQGISVMRALECKRPITMPWSKYQVYGTNNQRALNAPSVFSFFSPMHRAPGSNTLAPEQKLLDSKEFRERLGGLSSVYGSDGEAFSTAGCDFASFVTALEKSPQAFMDMMSQRLFRGSLTPPLRQATQVLLNETANESAGQRAALVMTFMLTTPAFGVIK